MTDGGSAFHLAVALYWNDRLVASSRQRASCSWRSDPLVVLTDITLRGTERERSAVGAWASYTYSLLNFQAIAFGDHLRKGRPPERSEGWSDMISFPCACHYPGCEVQGPLYTLPVRFYTRLPTQAGNKLHVTTHGPE